jgi:hypothetical protein
MHRNTPALDATGGVLRLHALPVRLRRASLPAAPAASVKSIRTHNSEPAGFDYSSFRRSIYDKPLRTEVL